MSIPTTLSRITTAQHPINAAKLETFENGSVKAHNVLSGIQEQLTAQIQKSSNESQREILDHIRTVLLENPADILSKDDLEVVEHSAATPQLIDGFSIKIKQSMLNALNHEIVTHIESTAPPDKAKHILRNALAESRLSALKDATERTPANSFIKTCMSEHIAAAVSQKEVAQQHLLKMQFSDTRDKFHDILTEAELRLAPRRKELEKIVASEKQTIQDYFHNVISSLVDSNKAELAQQYKLLEAETNNRGIEIDLCDSSIKKLRDNYEVKKTHLTEIIDAINKGDHPKPSKIITTPTLKKKIQDFINLCENKKISIHALKEAELELHSINKIINPAYISNVKILQDSINTNNVKMASEKSKLLHTHKKQVNKGWINNVAIKFIRLFGAGTNKKTKSEYNSDIKKIKKNINELEIEQKNINKELKKRLELLSEADLQIKWKLDKADKNVYNKQQNLAALTVCHNKLINEIKRLLSLEQEKALTELNIHENKLRDDYWYRRDKIVNNEEHIDDKILLLENEKKQLELMSPGNLVDKTTHAFLEKKLEGDKKLIEIKKMYSAWENLQNETSYHHKLFNSDVDEITKIRNEWFEAISKVEQGEQVDFSSTLEKAEFVKNKYNITFGEKYDSCVDIKIDLAQAASLYSMLCIDKLGIHKIDSMVNKATQAVPEILELVKKIEDETTNSDIYTIDTKTDSNSNPAQNRNKQNILQKLATLKKMANQHHEQFLNTSKDFSEQIYSSEYKIYVDKQKQHGTCVMHTWNNLFSYLTNNTQLQLTPYRTEKIIHAETLLSAKKLLGKITEKTKNDITERRLKEIDQVLLSILNDSNLILNISNSDLATNGHVMTFKEDNPSSIAKNHLNAISTSVFDMVGIRSEPHRHVFNAYSQQQDIERNLSEVNSSKVDAYQISFYSDKRETGHALALVRHGDNYLLIDSNHEEPIFLKFKNLVSFFTKKNRLPISLENIFTARNYSKYDNLIIRNGYFKEGTTYGD